jgi:hypothetical protein
MHKNRIEKFVTVAVLCGVLVLFALYLTHRDTNTLNSRAFHVEPLATDVPGWLTATDEIQGMTYMYPEVFGGTYSHPVEWPPSILSKRDGIACEVTNSESFPGGVVSIVSVGTRDYCLTTTSEGAAGSTYTTYTYEL